MQIGLKAFLANVFLASLVSSIALPPTFEDVVSLDADERMEKRADRVAIIDNRSGMCGSTEQRRIKRAFSNAQFISRTVARLLNSAEATRWGEMLFGGAREWAANKPTIQGVYQTLGDEALESVITIICEPATHRDCVNGANAFVIQSGPDANDIHLCPAWFRKTRLNQLYTSRNEAQMPKAHRDQLDLGREEASNFLAGANMYNLGKTREKNLIHELTHTEAGGGRYVGYSRPSSSRPGTYRSIRGTYDYGYGASESTRKGSRPLIQEIHKANTLANADSYGFLAMIIFKNYWGRGARCNPDVFPNPSWSPASTGGTPPSHTPPWPRSLRFHRRQADSCPICPIGSTPSTVKEAGVNMPICKYAKPQCPAGQIHFYDEETGKHTCNPLCDKGETLVGDSCKGAKAYTPQECKKGYVFAPVYGTKRATKCIKEDQAYCRKGFEWVPDKKSKVMEKKIKIVKPAGRKAPFYTCSKATKTSTRASSTRTQATRTAKPTKTQNPKADQDKKAKELQAKKEELERKKAEAEEKKKNLANQKLEDSRKKEEERKVKCPKGAAGIACRLGTAAL